MRTSVSALLVASSLLLVAGCQWVFGDFKVDDAAFGAGGVELLALLSLPPPALPMPKATAKAAIAATAAMAI